MNLAISTMVLLLLTVACGDAAPVAGDSADESPETEDEAAEEVQDSEGAEGEGTGQDFDAEEHYDGATVTLTVPWGPGSGADLQARSVAPYLEEALPGNPSVRVQNRDGAGGVSGLNNFYRTASDEGYEIAFTIIPATGQLFAEETGAEWDLTEVPHLGALGEAQITYANTERVSGPQDLYQTDEPMYVGLRGINSGASIAAVSDNTLMGYEMIGVTYPGGSADTRGALFRGEVDIFLESPTAYHEVVSPEVEAGNVTPLWQSGLLVDDEVVRDERAAEIPTIVEVYEEMAGEEVPDDAMEYIRTVAAAYVGNRVAMAAPGTPPEIVEVLADAWQEATRHPEFLEQGAIDGAPLFVLGPEEAQAASEMMLALPDNLVENYAQRFQEVLNE